MQFGPQTKSNAQKLTYLTASHILSKLRWLIKQPNGETIHERDSKSQCRACCLTQRLTWPRVYLQSWIDPKGHTTQMNDCPFVQTSVLWRHRSRCIRPDNKRLAIRIYLRRYQTQSISVSFLRVVSV